jgi:hypothetical protein
MSDCAHHLPHCQERETLSNQFSEFLRKVDVSRQGLLWFENKAISGWSLLMKLSRLL